MVGIQDKVLDILKKNKLLWLSVDDIHIIYSSKYGEISRGTINNNLINLFKKDYIDKKYLYGSFGVVYIWKK